MCWLCPPSPHRPITEVSMYFFLAHLSFIDVCYSCVILPKLILDSLHEKKTSSFNGCMIPNLWGAFVGGLMPSLLLVTTNPIILSASPYTARHHQLASVLVPSGSGMGGRHSMQLFKSSSPSAYSSGPLMCRPALCVIWTLFLNLPADTHTLGLFVANDDSLSINHLLLVWLLWKSFYSL